VVFGRARELAAIDEALAGAREGRGRLLVFVGEPGIGKTRLAEEATTRARALDVRAAWGRTWDEPGAPPGWPWTQIARAVVDDGVPIAPAERAGLAAIVPDLADAGGAPAAADELRTFDALLGLLRRAGRAAPRLVVLDDLHAADRLTLLGLHFVARAIRDLPVVVIATYRDAEARIRAEVQAVFARIARESIRFDLARLQEVEVAELLAARGGRAAAASWRAVHRTTEGNPLFVHEIAQLIETGRLDPDDPTAPLPDGVRAAIDGHVALLAPPTRSLLAVAAMLGRSFSRAELAAVTGAGDDDLDAALADASAAGVVAPAPGGGAFRHVLLAEALIAALPRGDRARLHGAIAAAAIAGAVGDARLTEIAHHLLEAGGDPA
jgi:predicted ATPase